MIKHVRKDGNLHMKINELKMPEVVYSERFDIHINQYLTQENIIAIAETALTMENLAQIDACIAYHTIILATDIDEKELEDVDVDVIMYGGLWEEVVEVVENIESVYDYIHYAQSADVAIAKFINNVLPDFMEKLDGQFSDYLDKMSDSGIKNISDELEKNYAGREGRWQCRNYQRRTETGWRKCRQLVVAGNFKLLLGRQLLRRLKMLSKKHIVNYSVMF